MKAWTFDHYGKGALRLDDVPAPTVRPTDVLIQIHAASVNLLDAKIRSGEFKLILPYRLPLTLGHDVAGIVVEVDNDVKKFKVGDEVFARADDFAIGTFAEQIAITEASVAKKPTTISMQEAASLPLVALTAWQALVERAQLKRGQSVFIQAGSGGVGTIAIQLAKHLGATVATTASASNAAWLKGLGADVVIDYKTQDFETVLRDVDVVLHSQDAATLEKSLRVLRPGGKLISSRARPTRTSRRRRRCRGTCTSRRACSAAALAGRRRSAGSPTSSSSCGPRARSCRSSLPSSTPAPSAPSSTRRSRSPR